MSQNNGVELAFQMTPSPRARLEAHPARAPGGRLPRVTQVMALAIQFQEMVRTGEVRDYADLARLAGLTRERISQVMKLAWLAPDIQMEILYLPTVHGDRFPVSEVAARKTATILSWVEQRAEWAKLKNSLTIP
jgi:hypothetical protein